MVQSQRLVRPKLPGKHGAPMLSLALESLAESSLEKKTCKNKVVLNEVEHFRAKLQSNPGGLWRRGVLLPHNEDGQTRWLRTGKYNIWMYLEDVKQDETRLNSVKPEDSQETSRNLP